MLVLDFGNVLMKKFSRDGINDEEGEFVNDDGSTVVVVVVAAVSTVVVVVAVSTLQNPRNVIVLHDGRPVL